MNLSEFNGSAAVKEQLSELENSNRFPHAVIIEGGSRSQRESLCDLLAMRAVCTENGEKPCGACRACINAKKHCHSDVKIIEGSGKTDSVSVDAIRAVTADCAVIANEADVKVYIIYDADKRLSGISQNAFLKTLEEPPSDVLFLLTCEDSGTLLETIRSRAFVFSLENKAEYTAEQIDIARQAALAMIADSEYGLLKICFSLKTPAQTDVILEILSIFMRDGLVTLCGASAQLDEQTAKTLSKNITREKFLLLGSVISSARLKIKQNVNMNLLTTWLCAEFRRIIWQK